MNENEVFHCSFMVYGAQITMRHGRKGTESHTEATGASALAAAAMTAAIPTPTPDAETTLLAAMDCWLEVVEWSACKAEGVRRWAIEQRATSEEQEKMKNNKEGA